MATLWTIGADAADPRELADFWARALGYVAEQGYDDPDGASIVDPDGKGPAIGFLRVPEGKTSKNRFHIDIRVAGEPPCEGHQVPANSPGGHLSDASDVLADLIEAVGIGDGAPEKFADDLQRGH